MKRLKAYLAKKPRNFEASVKRIGRALDLNEATVASNLRKLEAAGTIQWMRGSNSGPVKGVIAILRPARLSAGIAAHD
jgi:DNA-binding MarR family transcriptional regulator